MDLGTSRQQRTVCYVVSNDLVKVSSLLPSNRNRSWLVHSLVKEFGLLSPKDSGEGLGTVLKVIRPGPAEAKDLTAYHDRDYVEHLLSGSGDVPGLSDGSSTNAEYGLEEDCPYFPHLPGYVRLVAGAALSAARPLKEGLADISICWDGGRHHAQKAQASGFCYVADCVLVILALRRSFPIPNPSVGPRPSVKPRVLYLDLDLHFSDGVSQAFYMASPRASSPPQVLTFSIHHTSPGFFPASPLAALSDPDSASFDPFTLSLPLERGASDRTFRRIWPLVERVREAFRPDFVVLQCGADGLAGDPYATWNWSLGGGGGGGGGGDGTVEEGSFGWCVARVCRDWGCKTLLLGGGGYNSPNVARAWTYLTSVALNRPLHLEADIPDHDAFPLYAPSFTLDVPPGNTQDDNTEAYLDRVERTFARVVAAIEERMGPPPQAQA